MQTVILAAGRGTRIRPLSFIAPKPMLPVLDRPILSHVADTAIAAGTDELVLVVGTDAEQVRSFFGDRYGGVPVVYAEQESQEGTADALRCARQHLDGRFAVLNGDSLFDPESIVALFAQSCAIAVHEVDDPREYGVVSTDGHTATGIVEKPSTPPSNLVNAGAYIFPDWVREALDVEPSARGELELTDVLARVIDHESVTAVPSQRWMDIARPADLLAANQVLMQERPATVEGSTAGSVSITGDVQIGVDATIGEDVTLEGPVYVGRAATIERDVVLGGGTVVGADVTVSDAAVLDNCLVFPGAEVSSGVTLRNAIVGPNCTLSEGASIAGVTNTGGSGTAALVSGSTDADDIRYWGRQDQ